MRRIALTFLLLILIGFSLAIDHRDLAHSAAKQPAETPFGLPFDIPAGYSTWYVIQFYGNTTSSYTWRYLWYEAGQGMHFGVDFAAKCGTEVAAIGDGVVAKIDAREHGAGPHNLMIDHPEIGYASFYGHLLQAPQLYLGQSIHRGQIIGYTGDPDLTCTSRPHLHLEIRNIGYRIAYNPVSLIDADWDSLALLGGAVFERDLENPRRWVTPYDQPDIHFGQEMLNDYPNPWPPDWNY